MSRYVINILASRDLNEIAEYFVQTNLEAGERFFCEFNRKCQQLSAFPNSGKSYAKIRADLRGLPIEGYLARTRGSHRQFKHPIKLGLVIVPGKAGDDLAVRTLDSILKQAGLK